MTSGDSNIIYFNPDTANAWRGGGGAIPTLQQVLDNNHDLISGINLQGTNSGGSIQPYNLGNINSFGNYATYYSYGDDINAMGYNAAREMYGGVNNINAFGNNAGYYYGSNGSATYTDVNLFGSYAGANAFGFAVNAMGNSAAANNSGTNINAFGNNAASGNMASNVNAFGNGAGLNNPYSDVNLFGQAASATASNQIVFTGNSGSIQSRINQASVSADYTLPNTSGTLLTDAPSDGNTYGRKDNAWQIVSGGSGSGTVTDISQGYGIIASPTNPITTSGTISVDTATLSGKYVPYTGATQVVDLPVALRSEQQIFSKNGFYLKDYSIGSPTWISLETSINGGNMTMTNFDGTGSLYYDASNLTAARNYKFPDSSGTIALKQYTTLQQVTTLGATTSNNMKVQSGVNAVNYKNNSIEFLNVNIEPATIQTLYPNTYYFGQKDTLPTESGVLAISVNGNKADSSGNITLSTGTGGIPHGTASGTDTYAVTISGVSSYSDGDSYLIRFTNGNTTGCTLDINSLGAKTLYRNNDGVLIGGDILSGSEMLCIYNSTLDAFQTIGVAPNTLIGYVTNGESTTITKGQPVYAYSGTGDRMVVKLANNSGDATSAQTVGIVASTSIAANQKGIIMMQGLLDGLSTLPTSTWADGDPVYLGSTAGSITKVKPSAPSHLVYLGVVTTASAGSAGRMYVRIQNGYELEELHNVAISSPANNQVLAYSDTQSLWKNRNIYSIVDTVNTITTKYRTDTSRTNIYNAINTKQTIDTTTYYLISDFNTTSTTGANSNLTFNLGANEVRRIMIAGTCSKATSSTGLKVGIAAPTGATLKASVYGQLNTINATSNSILSAINTLSGTMNTAIATEMPFRIEGVITNGSTAGAVTLQLATVTSNTATIYAGTVMSVTKVKGL
jgi:hypothetical protein